MAQARRMAVDGEKQRDLLIDAAEQILNEDGYAALSARKVTSRAGLKSQLIYYYFETMDDLILQLLGRVNARRRERLEQAIASTDPIRALWDLNSDPSGSRLSAELISLAAHRESIRLEIVQSASEFRKLQTEALARFLERAGGIEPTVPVAGLMFIMTAVARILSSEAQLGLDEGHDEARVLVEQALEKYSSLLRSDQSCSV